MTRKKRQECRKRAEDRKAARKWSRGYREKMERKARRAEIKYLHRPYIREEEAIYALLSGGSIALEGRTSQAFRDVVEEIAGASKDKREKLKRLFAAVFSHSPKCATRDGWQLLYLLSLVPWKAALSDWRPRGKSRNAILFSLVDHLVVEYPVPRFLYGVFHSSRGCRGETLVHLFAYLAAGGSVFKYFRSSFIRVVMTRRMCHLFLNMPEGMPVFHAIRRAQVEALGGSRSLARAICGTFLGLWFMSDERFWLSVIKWFCENPLGDNVSIGPLLDFMAEMHRRDDNYSLKGRTARSLTRAMEEWHRELGCSRVRRNSVYSPAGFKALTWKVKTADGAGNAGGTVWGMTEILSTADLVKEGRKMRHCVVMYDPEIVRGMTSIWSLKCDDQRMITVRVDISTKAVIEARGKCNRMPKTGEMNRIKRWAQINNLAFKVG
jgi:hypothetical protein